MNSKYIFKKGILALVLAMVLLSSVMLTACTGTEVSVVASDGTNQTVSQDLGISSDSQLTADYDEDDVKDDFSDSEISKILFSNESIE